MRTFTQLNEGLAKSVTSDVNPGNAFPNNGVMNHYTPIENIITNVRNLWAPMLSVVATIGEDGVSIKLHSTKFVNKEEISKVLDNTTIHRGLSLRTYIMQQGLDLIKMINVGQYWIVYFCPRDIPQASGSNPQAGCNCPTCDCGCCPCTEQLDDEVEMDTFITEDDDDEEIKDVTKKKIIEAIKMKDKVKAAKQLELIVAQSMELPREYYFAGVKTKKGTESIALRWKYQKRSGIKETTEITKSLVNIYGDGDDAIFVADFDKDSMFELPDEVKKLIENLLELLGAEETDDKAVYKLGEDKDEDKKEDDKDEDKDKDKDEDKEDKKDDDDDNEDDDSRGDKSDDLLG